MGIKKPPGYMHPRKRKSANAERAPEQPIQDAKTDNPIKEKGKVAQKSLPSKPSRSLPPERSEQVRLVLYPPVIGQLQIYDDMIDAGFTPKHALLGLLKKGFSDFEAMLLAEEITDIPDELEVSGNSVDTTRNVSHKFIDAAKSLFDPFDILSDRALGRRIAEAVINSVGKERADG